MFPNIWTTNEKYSLLNRDNLRQPIQVQLWKKEKTFPHFFSAFFKCSLNFEHLEKEMTPIADVYPKLRTPKNVVNQISLKVPFHRTLQQAPYNGDKTLLKSEWHHLYHIYWSLWRKQKTYSEFIAAFLKARLIFGLFETRNNLHTWFISNITDSEKQISKKSTFRGLLEKQHVNSLTLSKSERHHLYHIY